MAASLALTEFVGPCRFSHFDRDGTPRAKPHSAPWVQVAATTQDQTRNTMTLLPGMLSADAMDEYGVDLGKTIAYSRAGGRIEAVTSSPRAIEGGRPTYVILNECLALDTPIPSPAGWTTMGALADGDVIYGSDGAPTTVTAALPVQHDRRCYRVTFADGTSVVASDGHLWYVKRSAAPPHAAAPKVLSTEQIAEDGRRWRVPAPGPRQAPERPLPVDPYLLGYWLGNGDTGASALTMADADLPEIQRILKERGIDTTVLQTKPGKAPRLSFSNRQGFGAAMGTEPAQALRALPCYRDKHIPEDYLHGSIEQRTDLLRGLMDSDGCATTGGHSVFIGTERLGEDIVALLRSLGQAVRSTWTPDARSRHGGYARVTFTPRGLVPYALPRKAERVRGDSARQDWVTITSIEPVETVPVRCIAVDAPDHLFQAGVSGMVTHNTHHWIDANEGTAMAKAIARNLAKSRDGSARALAITNAHEPGEESVAQADWEAWQQVASGESIATGYLYDSLQAPDSVSLSDREELRAGLIAARGDSDWLDVDRLIEEIHDPTTPPSISRRYYLNQITVSEDAWIAPWQWAERTDTSQSIADGETITLGFDGSIRSDATALVACRVSDGHLTLLGAWERPAKLGDDGDWQVPRREVDAAVAAAMDRFRVVGFYADPPHWQDAIDRWTEQWGRRMLVKATVPRPLEWWTQRTSHMVTALERFYEAVVTGQLTHDGDATLTRHILNAKRRVQRAGLTIGKEHPHSPRHIDAAIAAVLAYEARADAVARRLDRDAKRASRTRRRAYGF